MAVTGHRTDGVTQSQTEAVNANKPVQLLIFYALSFQFRSEVSLFVHRFPDIEMFMFFSIYDNKCWQRGAAIEETATVSAQFWNNSTCIAPLPTSVDAQTAEPTLGGDFKSIR